MCQNGYLSLTASRLGNHGSRVQYTALRILDLFQYNFENNVYSINVLSIIYVCVYIYIHTYMRKGDNKISPCNLDHLYN